MSFSKVFKHYEMEVVSYDFLKEMWTWSGLPPITVFSVNSFFFMLLWQLHDTIKMPWRKKKSFSLIKCRPLDILLYDKNHNVISCHTWNTCGMSVYVPPFMWIWKLFGAYRLQHCFLTCLYWCHLISYNLLSFLALSLPSTLIILTLSSVTSRLAYLHLRLCFLSLKSIELHLQFTLVTYTYSFLGNSSFPGSFPCINSSIFP